MPKLTDDQYTPEIRAFANDELDGRLERRIEAAAEAAQKTPYAGFFETSDPPAPQHIYLDNSAHTMQQDLKDPGLNPKKKRRGKKRRTSDKKLLNLAASLGLTVSVGEAPRTDATAMLRRRSGKRKQVGGENYSNRQPPRPAPRRVLCAEQI